jgi:putative ABC transport system ATP-binding protein
MTSRERQRVAIARALMNEPKLILVDEPTSALDTERGRQVMELIVGEVKQRGTAAIIVTHDTRMVRYADSSVEIVDGRLAAEVTT